MKLGKFSVSLNVKNIQQSKAFYEKLGFNVVGSEEKDNWLIKQGNQEECPIKGRVLYSMCYHSIAQAVIARTHRSYQICQQTTHRSQRQQIHW